MDPVNLLWPVRVVVPNRPCPVITTEHLPICAEIIAVHSSRIHWVQASTSSSCTDGIWCPGVGRDICRRGRERSGRGRPWSCVLRLSLGGSDKSNGHDGRDAEALHRMRIACSKSALGAVGYECCEKVVSGLGQAACSDGRRTPKVTSE